MHPSVVIKLFVFIATVAAVPVRDRHSGTCIGSAHSESSGVECATVHNGAIGINSVTASSSRSRARSYNELMSRSTSGISAAMRLVHSPENSGTCIGSAHSRLRGVECAELGAVAIGFRLKDNGPCISPKLAKSSLYANESGDCFKRINQ